MNFLLAALIMMLAPQRVHIGQNVTVPNGGVTPPQVLTYNEAFYTSEARMNKVEGTVTVEAAGVIANVVESLSSLWFASPA